MEAEACGHSGRLGSVSGRPVFAANAELHRLCVGVRVLGTLTRPPSQSLAKEASPQVTFRGQRKGHGCGREPQELPRDHWHLSPSHTKGTETTDEQAGRGQENRWVSTLTP